MRAVEGLVSLARRHAAEEIDRACRLALESGAYRLKAVKVRIGSTQEQTRLFVSEHPVIRSMAEYGRLVQVVFGDGAAEVASILAPRPRPPSAGGPASADDRPALTGRGEAGAEGRVH